ncbi:MAG: sulfotransferase family protein [Bacteroidota bacterium]
MITVTIEDRIAFAHHVFISKPHRFIFFTIPKVACTDWIRLFVRLQGKKDWKSDPHFRAGKPLLSKLEGAAIETYLKDKNWTKAVFLRDPAERLLSAYLDKVNKGTYVMKKILKSELDSIPFREFVDFAIDSNQDLRSRRGLHQRTDPHWKPQYLLSNLYKFMPCINYIGHFSNLYEDTKRLLQSVDLWEPYGSTGWGKDGKQALFFTNDAVNRTDAQQKMDIYYSEDLLMQVKKAYQQDYELLAMAKASG